MSKAALRTLIEGERVITPVQVYAPTETVQGSHSIDSCRKIYRALTVKM